MELSIVDRLLIIESLPKKGNEMKLLTKRDLVEKLRMQEDEQDLIEILDDGNVKLKDVIKAREEKREFEFTKQEVNMIFGTFDRAVKKDDLDEKYLDLYLLFKKA